MRGFAGEPDGATLKPFVSAKIPILILVENLPVPLDRRVWQEACALRDAGYEVAVVCPRMRGFTAPEEILDGIQIYRHWISDEAGGFLAFFHEYGSALWGQFYLACKAWWRHRFKLIHICNPPDLLFLIAAPFRLLFDVKVVFDVHDICPEMFEAKFEKRGFVYWTVRVAEWLTYRTSGIVLATNESVRDVAIERGGKPGTDVFIVRTSPDLQIEKYPPDLNFKKGRRFLVCYIGVLGNADGVNYLIDAIHHVVHARGRKDIQFLLMGTGPEFKGLVAQRDRLGLQDCCDMPGRVSNEFLFTGLNTMDVGISCDPINSYNTHCTMNKTLEYMAFGKPQVLFDLKEGRASAGDSAYYVPENSAVQLGDTLLRLLDDPEARKRMGRLAWERLSNELNWRHSVKQLTLAYQRALMD
jgi:glycosyltransferase involved in cell wall biosynthesis